MRSIREVLRLSWGCGLSDRVVARSCSVARSTVAKYLRLAREAGLAWPLPEAMSDEALEQRLFPLVEASRDIQRFVPDWAELHQELRRKGVTLQLLWQEYRMAYPDGYRYSQFCTLYRQWREKLDVSMRQDHKAGEKMFVDYCGQTVPITGKPSGEIHEAQVFVAVLGASNYTFAEATWTQCLPEWIESHVHAFRFFGGVPALVISDNLRSGVTTAHRYEPEINRTYEEMAQHYATAILPARVRKPKDKAKVEKGVQDVQQRILAPLRHRTFFSLGELNEALAELLQRHNTQSFQKMPGSRRSLFESLDKPALKPLPPTPYEYAVWFKARLNIDYHAAVEGHYYSAPYALVGQTLDVRLSAMTVELFHKNKRVASHVRSPRKSKHTTVDEHMPKGHRQYAQWTPERLVRWAQKTGGETARAVEAILSSRPHPQQGFRACLGIMRLGKLYGEERLEAACARALCIQAVNYKSIESILKNGLDRKPLKPKRTPAAPIEHDNIRGPEYYSEN